MSVKKRIRAAAPKARKEAIKKSVSGIGKRLSRGADRVATVRKSHLIGFPEPGSFKLDFAEFKTRYEKDFGEGVECTKGRNQRNFQSMCGVYYAFRD